VDKANIMDWATHTALVVEDSAVQREHATGLLKALGFGCVLDAENGRHALRLLEARGSPVSLVMTDLDMPEMDGIELIRHLSAGRMADNLIVTSARDPRLFEIVERMASEYGSMQLLGTLAKPVLACAVKALLERIGGCARRCGAIVAAKPKAGEIDAAIRGHEFEPFFQPKVCVRTGAIEGVEALARWRHPKLGVLTPDNFIPVIEGTPLMAAFTLQITEETLKQLAQLRSRGMTSLTASINLSADDLGDRIFIDTLTELVAAYHIPFDRLIWEVTETMLMKNLLESLANLARLGLKGFGLAMDDYGIGYSSIEQFSRCPFTELKIDRTFVNDASRRPNRRVVLESAIEMGHRLNVHTVAEGVESHADWELLRELGCDFAQGYLIARPMPASELWQWITAQSSTVVRQDTACKNQ
jgi:EAL domain-containing protein (putative c-di-GMP-specific phosphodiesterase class I)/CheY-like chemotaxis protein